jgi:hypothetical protein
MGLVKSCGSRRVDSSIVSVESRERKSSFFLGFAEGRDRLRFSGTAAVATGFTKTVYIIVNT